MKKILFSIVALFIAINLHAAVPGTITYQGVLTDGSGVLINGTPDIKFEIFLASGGGLAQWNETQSSVSVVNGVFNVELGSVTPFGALDFSVPYWLQITIDPTGTPTVLTPRIAFNSSGYAQNTKKVIGGTIDNSVIGGTTPAAGSFTTLNAGSNKLTVDANGNITKLNNVTTSFPASQGAVDTYLKNDGSGNLSWATAGGGGSFPAITSISSVANNTLSATSTYQTANSATIASNGYYLIVVNMQLTSSDFTSGAYEILLRLRLNGTTTLCGQAVSPYGSAESNKTYISMTYVGQFVNTDVIAVQIASASNSTPSVDYGTSSKVSIVKLAN